MPDPISIDPRAVYDDGVLLLRFGFAPGTLVKARRSGQLRFTRKGQRIVYLGEWILDWLNADSAEPAVAKRGQQ